MAKSVKNEKEVVAKDVTPINVEPVSEEATVEPAKSEETPIEVEPSIEIKASPKTKLVEIHTLEEVDARIGGITYKFRKDTDQKVPVDVAAILSNSRQAYRK